MNTILKKIEVLTIMLYIISFLFFIRGVNLLLVSTSERNYRGDFFFYPWCTSISIVIIAKIIKNIVKMVHYHDKEIILLNKIDTNKDNM